MQHLKKLNTKLASLETQSLVAFMRLNPKTTFWAQGRNQPKDHLLGLGEESTQRPPPGLRGGLNPKTKSWTEVALGQLVERRPRSSQCLKETESRQRGLQQDGCRPFTWPSVSNKPFHEQKKNQIHVSDGMGLG
ncbi:unnamed protein product [Arctogadus glacialis]